LQARKTIKGMSTESGSKSHYKWSSKDGEFRRQISDFTSVIEVDGKFPPEPDRYHLYVSYACPWAHRTLIARALKKLSSLITVDVVDHHLDPKGWKFPVDETEVRGATPDSINGKRYLREIYELADPSYSKRWTVPVLWDKKTKTIVSNESADILRMLNTCFESVAPKSVDLYPQEHRTAIDELNAWIYPDINNGVYKTGFATSQEAYESNCKKLFISLQKVDGILSTQPYIAPTKTISEADIRLFTTIYRFDPVYITHFKCNLGTIANNFPNILTWMRRIYQIPGVKETCDLEHIKKHYFISHIQINPNMIVGLNNGPDLDSPKVAP